LNGYRLVFDRRLASEPIGYILGEKEFFGIPLMVGPGTLIPRPETEVLVEIALERCKTIENISEYLNIIDVGTGSGAIAITLARYLSNFRVYGIDVSEDALRWAKKNEELFNLHDNIELNRGDLLSDISVALEHKTSVLVANLPYIPTEEANTLPEEIREQEPFVAIDGGEDGLDLFRRLAVQLSSVLTPDLGCVLFEVGAGQISWVEDIIRDGIEPITDKVLKVSHHRDLTNTRRVLEISYGI
jgi:release factor glutamine methyltransferase